MPDCLVSANPIPHTPPALPFTYPSAVYLTPLPAALCKDTTPPSWPVDRQGTWLQQRLPPALWQQLLVDFADPSATTRTVGPVAQFDSLSVSLKSGPSKKHSSATPPFGVQWLSAALARSGLVLTPITATTHDQSDADSDVINNLSAVVVALCGLASASPRSQTADGDGCAAFFFLTLSFLHWFEQTLCEAQQAQMTRLLQKRRVHRKVLSLTTQAKTLPGKPCAAETLRRLLTIHAARFRHPARFFEQHMCACVSAIAATGESAVHHAETASVVPTVGGKRPSPARGLRPVTRAIPARHALRTPARRPRRRARSYSITSSTSTSSSSTDEDISDVSDDEVKHESVVTSRRRGCTQTKRTAPAHSRTLVRPTAPEKTLAELMAAPARLPAASKKTKTASAKKRLARAS